MSRATEPIRIGETSDQVRKNLEGKHVCPFCGSVNGVVGGPCPRCTMENTPAARKATKSRIGPWYVLQTRNPAAPGMRFETLIAFVKKGRVRPRSVVRGPTTHQLWRFAAHVKGLSREFGLCYSCGGSIETTANLCPQCNRLQEPPPNPDVLLEGSLDDSSSGSAAASTSLIYRELRHATGSAAASEAREFPIEEPAPEAPDEVEIIIPALGGISAAPVKPQHTEPARPEPIDTVLPPLAPARPQQQYLTEPVTPTAPATPSVSPRAFPAQFETISGAAPTAAAAPAPKRPANGNEMFLSAKELAAAFKLDFAPSANYAAAGDGQGVQVAQAGAMGQLGVPLSEPPDAYTAEFRPEPRRKRRSFFKTVVLLLVLAAGALAALMYFDPSFRQQATDWFDRNYAAVRDYVNPPVGPPRRSQPTTPKSRAAKATTPAAPAPSAGGRESRPGATEAGVARAVVRDSTADEPVARRDDNSIDSPRGANSADGAIMPEKPAAGTAAVERRTDKQPAPVPSTNRRAPKVAPPRESSAEGKAQAKPASPSPAPPPAKPQDKVGGSAPDGAAPEEVDPARKQPAPAESDRPADGEADSTAAATAAAQAEEVERLYAEAIDAQANGDYAAAVSAYEKLLTFPRDLRPTDVEVRLRIVKSQIEQ